ncbi:HlyD family secretion protein [Jejubacter calystegiae]|uniref:HlyD family secretion protein n=1 Tax=Jejubacter calystegiae TaxID=2579935 RepID=A0A4P8YQC0_9ENTR|nr:HlyD family secretion protein [Jejubacter calystegiae]QCT22248.1 HlyD family secretion protein [Jejubacter calystegiae]
MSKKGLFRQEALENAKARWLGQALLLSSYPGWVVMFLTCAFIGVLLSVIIFCDYTRRINVNGEVTSLPRAVNIFSPGQGFISHARVKVGEWVKKGDSLYQIDVSRTTRSGNVSENVIQAMREQILIVENIIRKLEVNKKSTLAHMEEQLAKYQNALQESYRVVNNAKKGMADMKLTMENYVDYKRRGLINNDQLTNQRYLYYQQQSVYQNLNTQLIQQSLQIISLEDDIVTKATGFDNQIAQNQYQLSNLRRQLAEMDATGTLLVSSPLDGRIESLSVTQGQMVNNRDSLAQIVPENSQGYFLILWLPDSSLPYVGVGDKINIRYEAFPYEKFGQFSGEIVSVSSVPASPQELASYSNPPKIQQNGMAEPFYKAIVNIEFDHRRRTLRLTNGMKAQATVFLERRPLYQWILSPFYDVVNSLMGPVNG